MFDPAAIQLTCREGRLYLSVDAPMERFLPNAVGNAAANSVDIIMSVWLAGERQAVSRRLRTAFDWLRDAEERGERFGPPEEQWFHTARRRRALALAYWLHRGSFQAGLWAAAADASRRDLSESGPAQGNLDAYLSAHLLDCLLARRPSDAIEAAAEFGGRAELTPELGGLIRIAEGGSSAAAADTARATLRQHLEGWLSGAEASHAAGWILLERLLAGDSLDPETTLLSAYDALAHIAEPDAVQRRRSDLAEVSRGATEVLARVLTEALGPSPPDDLFIGLAVGFGRALRDGAASFITAPEVLSEVDLVVRFVGRAPLRLPPSSRREGGGLGAELSEALAAVAQLYEDAGLGLPTLQALLWALSSAAGGGVTGTMLLGVEAVIGREESLQAIELSELLQADALRRWRAQRSILATTGPAPPEYEALVADGLNDPDWRVRMTAVLAVGRLRIATLADQARAAATPARDVGLRDEDRRALLALREAASERARPGGELRPIHPDPETARRRAAFMAEVANAVAGERELSAGGAVSILDALEAPEQVSGRPDAPVAWRRWLGEAVGDQA
jgi:hypothetical protein